MTGTARPTFRLLYRELVRGLRVGRFGTGGGQETGDRRQGQWRRRREVGVVERIESFESIESIDSIDSFDKVTDKARDKVGIRPLQWPRSGRLGDLAGGDARLSRARGAVVELGGAGDRAALEHAYLDAH